MLTPVATDQKFLRISTAWQHTCGLTVHGKAYCWGNNLQGQIGNDAMGTHAYWPTPVAFDGTFIAIGTGRQSSCGLTGDGKIYCWGGDTANISGGPFKGMLGDGGTAEDKAVPVAIDSALRFVGLTVGWDHVCGQTQSGASSCWGRNNLGAFGNATTANDNFSPVPVAHALNFLSFAGGESHTCGLADDGEAYCWGGGLGGSLGTGNQTHRSSPTLLDASAPSLRSMAAGYRYSCGIAMDGSGFCWGQDLHGRIGINGTVDANVLVPTALATSDKLTMISAGYNHTCALTAANDAMCWGRDTDGQLASGAAVATSLSAPPSTYISCEQ